MFRVFKMSHVPVRGWGKFGTLGEFTAAYDFPSSLSLQWADLARDKTEHFENASSNLIFRDLGMSHGPVIDEAKSEHSGNLSRLQTSSECSDFPLAYLPSSAPCRG